MCVVGVKPSPFKWGKPVIICGQFDVTKTYFSSISGLLSDMTSIELVIEFKCDSKCRMIGWPNIN